MKKLFIFDVDGVLLDLWTSMKPIFAVYHGMLLSNEDWDDIVVDFLHDPKPYLEFGEYFQKSLTFRTLTPVEGMPQVVFDLLNRGFDLAIVSSSDPRFAEQRRQNIETHYPDCFEKIICVGMEQTKEEALRKAIKGYDEVFFVDDNPRHLADSLGIVDHPIWMANKHHKFIWDEMDTSGIEVVHSPKELLDLALKR